MSELLVKQNNKWHIIEKAYIKKQNKWEINEDIFNTPTGEGVSDDTLEIILITDTHLKAGVDKNPNATGAMIGNRAFYGSHSNMRHFVDVVKNTPCDLVVHLGDICDTPNDFNFFNSLWGNITKRKELIIGNHDFDDMTYSQLRDVLGYNQRPFVFGSNFNKSFVINKGNNSVRFLMVDTNFDENNNHSNTARGRFHTNTLEWLESELISTKENTVILMSHHIPHFFNYPQEWAYFNNDSAMQFKAIVDQVKLSKPNLKIYYLGGHQHALSVLTFNNLGDNVIGYVIPSTIIAERGKITKLGIESSSNLKFTVDNLEYPYPI